MANESLHQSQGMTRRGRASASASHVAMMSRSLNFVMTWNKSLGMEEEAGSKTCVDFGGMDDLQG